jgi:hypothetical protein
LPRVRPNERGYVMQLGPDQECVMLRRSEAISFLKICAMLYRDDIQDHARRHRVRLEFGETALRALRNLGKPQEAS